ncbi:MAG TPA: tyrosine-type recombinase/integrase [Candidatus Limnocylindria bacterium]|jgi:site-specific recombinase XerD|nr:tyrosine-type recombinase/integrase [Candidatus Limnocylindria bacterium]
MSSIGQVLFAFFEDHLKVQKGLRPGSVRSYRDTLKLFLVYVATACRRPVTRLTLPDLTSERVLEFLRMIESSRGNQVRTRNQRLAALHTFYRYLAVRRPEMLAEAERVEGIPTKRTQAPNTLYLEREEIDALFRALPREGPFALRDRALLMLLYNSGARVQEIADLRVTDVDLNGPFRVRLHGKGDKWRSCPLWPETAEVLKQLETVHSADKSVPLFTSHKFRPLTRFGIYKLVKRHTASLHSSSSGTKRCGVSPHVFRHSTAVHLLEQGVDVNVIRGWLGHVSLDTTHRYAEITLRTKQAAVAACLPPVGTSETFRPSAGWRKDQDLMKWLCSL